MTRAIPQPGSDSHRLPAGRISYPMLRPRQPKNSGNHRSRATAVAKSIAAKHGSVGLRYHDCYRTPIGKQYLFQQTEGKLPVSRGWIKIVVDDEGAINGGFVSLAKRKSRRHTVGPKGMDLSGNKVVEIAKKLLFSEHGKLTLECDPEAVCVRTASDLVPAWKVILNRKEPRISFKVYIDDQSRHPIIQIPLIQHIMGTGSIFNPNPVVSLNRWDFSPTTTLPDSVYTKHSLLGLDDSGYLSGPWVRIIRSDGRTPVRRSNGVFSFSREHPGFSEGMAYFHIDRAQRYIQSLGFTKLGDRQTVVDVAASAADSSYYDPQSAIIRLGTGGVPDAEDAEIILHEYGHAIQAHAIPNFGLEPLSSELAEGFCDYFAASFFDNLKIGALKACLASWNALGKMPAVVSVPTLRRLDRNEVYTLASMHKREIWSSCLWKLRQEALGPVAADRCILGAHYYLGGPFPTPYEYAVSILQANRYFNQSYNEQELVQVFRSRAIFG